MKDKATFQNKVKVLNKLFDSGCDTEKKLQQLDMEAILKIPNITIPDMGVIMELQKNTKSGKLFSYLGGGSDEATKMRGKENEAYAPALSGLLLMHTAFYCTQLAQKNMNPKNLQYIMGHASITITLDLYAHASEAGANRELRSLVA